MPARVTQEVIEVLYSDPLPPGEQFTDNPILAKRLPDYSWINPAYTQTLPPIYPVASPLTPDPILAKRLPDYSHIGPYFMREPRALITQEGIEILMTGDSLARITQMGVEVLINTRPLGQQYYANPILARRLPDYSFIGPYFMREPSGRVTQAGIEVLRVGTPSARLTQAGLEVMTVRMPVSRPLTPDPILAKRLPDYSWIAEQSQIIYMTTVGGTAALSSGASTSTSQSTQARSLLASISLLTSAPAGTVLMTALATMQENGQISAAALAAAQAAMFASSGSTGNVLAAALAATTSQQGISALASLAAASVLSAIPQGLALLGSTATMATAGAAVRLPPGALQWQLPPTKPSAYFDYSWVSSHSPGLIPRGGGETFQVVMVL